MTEIKDIHKVLLQFQKRAENKPEEVISSTFVDAEPLLDILQAPLNQVIFGRRGTGKTHALKYCLNSVKEAGNLAVYLDIRSIGSNGSFYSDESIEPVERGLRLVNDILQALVDELYPYAIQKIDEGYDATQITLRLDDLISAIGNVKIAGVTEVEVAEEHKATSGKTGKIGMVVGANEASLQLSGGLEAAHETLKLKQSKAIGHEKRYIDFSNTQVALDGLLQILGVKEMWLFLDEWSETHLSVQPFLADLIRKSILPIGKIIVKIAAIEQRSRFVLPRGRNQYIGLELGADIGVDLNLDEFLVFDYDEDRAIAFFRELIFKNYSVLTELPSEIGTATALSNAVFCRNKSS